MGESKDKFGEGQKYIRQKMRSEFWKYKPDEFEKDGTTKALTIKNLE